MRRRGAQASGKGLAVCTSRSGLQRGSRGVFVTFSGPWKTLERDCPAGSRGAGARGGVERFRVAERRGARWDPGPRVGPGARCGSRAAPPVPREDTQGCIACARPASLPPGRPQRTRRAAAPAFPPVREGRVVLVSRGRLVWTGMPRETNGALLLSRTLRKRRASECNPPSLSHSLHSVF